MKKKQNLFLCSGIKHIFIHPVDWIGNHNKVFDESNSGVSYSTWSFNLGPSRLTTDLSRENLLWILFPEITLDGARDQMSLVTSLVTKNCFGFCSRKSPWVICPTCRQWGSDCVCCVQNWRAYWILNCNFTICITVY